MTGAMSDTETPKRRRRTRAEIIEAQRKRLELLEQAEKKDQRRQDNRLKIALGGYIRAAAVGGDAAAAEMVKRWKRTLTRPEDLQAYERLFTSKAKPTAKPKPASPVVDEAALRQAIEAEVKANQAAAAAGNKEEQNRSAEAWRQAIVAYERATGKWWFPEGHDDRKRYGFGGLGERI